MLSTSLPTILSKQNVPDDVLNDVMRTADAC